MWRLLYATSRGCWSTEHSTCTRLGARLHETSRVTCLQGITQKVANSFWKAAEEGGSLQASNLWETILSLHLTSTHHPPHGAELGHQQLQRQHLHCPVFGVQAELRWGAVGQQQGSSTPKVMERNLYWPLQVIGCNPKMWGCIIITVIMNANESRILRETRAVEEKPWALLLNRKSSPAAGLEPNETKGWVWMAARTKESYCDPCTQSWHSRYKSLSFSPTAVIFLYFRHEFISK